VVIGGIADVPLEKGTTVLVLQAVFTIPGYFPDQTHERAIGLKIEPTSYFKVDITHAEVGVISDVEVLGIGRLEVSGVADTARSGTLCNRAARFGQVNAVGVSVNRIPTRFIEGPIGDEIVNNSH
jgi:hypothetical protein